MDKQKKSTYDQQYQKTHMKSLTVWFNKEKDADILAFLETAKSKTQLVKDCIRKQMENSGKEGKKEYLPPVPFSVKHICVLLQLVYL